MELIDNQGVTRFPTGGMTEFAELFAKTVHFLCGGYPQILLFLTCLDLTKSLNEQFDNLAYVYDEIVILSELENAHKKAALLLRNHWMIAQSDVVLSVAHRDFGGDNDMAVYAESRVKQLFVLCNFQNSHNQAILFGYNNSYSTRR